MIDIHRKRIVVDGSPRILMCGEVHYFRLAREEWADRLDALVAAGCDAVASYIPWLCHELPDGTFDLDGRTRPELDLGAFIDLCRDHGLSFFARPGPFIMAELKNEGPALPPLRRAPGDPSRSPGTAGRCHAHGRLPRAGLPRRGAEVVRAR